jgi:hypothetical protein
MIVLSLQQRNYFVKNGFLELEGYASEEMCKSIISELKFGRDSWRSSPLLKTFLTSRQIGKIISSLTQSSPFRLACDHYFKPGTSIELESTKDMLCIQGILCSAFLRLDSSPLSFGLKASPLGLTPFPQSKGNLLLVKPDLLLQLPSPNLPLYMFSYASVSSVYFNNSKDQFKDSYKQLGYDYGDRLKNELHPLLKG